MKNDQVHDREEISRPIPCLERYNASPLFGFVEPNPATDLPAYFQPWVELAYQTQRLVQEGAMRDWVMKLPLLDHAKLDDPREWRTALLFLTCIVYGFVWCEGEEGIPETLPRCIAVPYAAVAKKLEIVPSVSQYSFILLNWKLKDPKGAVELDNMESVVNLRGGADESWFYCTTAQVELNFAPALAAIIEAQKAVVADHMERVIQELKTIEGAIHKMKHSLNRMPEGCRPNVFFNVIRPFITGWDSAPFKKKSLKGLVYEGVSDVPFSLTGLSAAQSSTLPCLDAAFGVTHNESEEKTRVFFQDFMPKPHRDLIKAIAAGPSIKEFVHGSGSPSAVNSFNDCLKAMQSFRDAHLQVVTRFIIVMANVKSERDTATPVSQGAMGTGGTDLIRFLKGLRDSTVRAMLGQVSAPSSAGRGVIAVETKASSPWFSWKRAVKMVTMSAAMATITLIIMKRFVQL